MAVFKSYDPSFTKQDLSELPGAIKQGARDLFKKLPEYILSGFAG